MESWEVGITKLFSILLWQSDFVGSLQYLFASIQQNSLESSNHDGPDISSPALSSSPLGRASAFQFLKIRKTKAYALQNQQDLERGTGTQSERKQWRLWRPWAQGASSQALLCSPSQAGLNTSPAWQPGNTGRKQNSYTTIWMSLLGPQPQINTATRRSFRGSHSRCMKTKGLH